MQKIWDRIDIEIRRKAELQLSSPEMLPDQQLGFL
jgi:hypothetical protein